MGIATSTGVIRDFAGPYHVAEDNMTFGKPTKYVQLSYAKAKGGVQGWDSAVAEASEIYKTRMVSVSYASLLFSQFPLYGYVNLLHSTSYAATIVTLTWPQR